MIAGLLVLAFVAAPVRRRLASDTCPPNAHARPQARASYPLPHPQQALAVSLQDAPPSCTASTLNAIAFGAAGAAYQTEGSPYADGRSASIWDVYIKNYPDKVRGWGGWWGVGDWKVGSIESNRMPTTRRTHPQSIPTNSRTGPSAEARGRGGRVACVRESGKGVGSGGWLVGDG